MKYLFLLFGLTGLAAFGQRYVKKEIDFQKIQFGSPMEIPLILAGNFGEMRANHFHTGLDIKTLGVEGQKILAVEDGYISRVRISESGYGKAIYIDHPNGITSLYAHLSRFPAEIDSFIYAQQARMESDEIDEFVLVDSFFVKKGQLIAYSGNSGSSSAPHLHFELRETKTEHALNPLLFNCYQSKIKDTTPPTISGIKIYAITEKGYMIPGKSAYYPCIKIGNDWIINDNKPVDISALITEKSLLGIGFQSTDKLDAANNVCGIHHSILSKDGVKKHEQQIDYLVFDKNRFMNTHQDYYEFKQNKKDIHKHYTTIVNPLEIYPLNDGKFKWEECAGNYEFIVYDVHGNANNVRFNVAPSTAKPAPNPFDQKGSYLFPDSVNTFLKSDFQVLMEPASFYEPLQLIYRVDTNSSYLSKVYQFCEAGIPVQSKFDVRIKVDALPATFPLYKLAIGSVSDNGRISYIGGYYVDGWVECQTRTFGKYVIVVDSISPVITPLDFAEGKVITKFKTLELTISDNLAGIKSYKAYLNDNWVLMNYDRKAGRYIIPLDARSKPFLKAGNNQLRITTKDYKGNTTEKSYNLTY